MRRLVFTILFSCVVYNLWSQTETGAQNNKLNTLTVGALGLTYENVLNSFNSPLIYSGPGVNIDFAYNSTDYGRTMLYADINAGLALLSHSSNYFLVGKVNVEARYGYLSSFYRSANGFSLYAGGTIISDVYVRQHSDMENSATDVNATISLSPSFGMTYRRERYEMRWIADIPIVSLLLVPPYTGGLTDFVNMDVFVASLGSYQRFTSDFSFTLFLKKRNALKFGYEYNFFNINRQEKITMGGNMLSVGYVINLSKSG